MHTTKRFMVHLRLGLWLALLAVVLVGGAPGATREKPPIRNAGAATFVTILAGPIPSHGSGDSREAFVATPGGEAPFTAEVAIQTLADSLRRKAQDFRIAGSLFDGSNEGKPLVYETPDSAGFILAAELDEGGVHVRMARLLQGRVGGIVATTLMPDELLFYRLRLNELFYYAAVSAISTEIDPDSLKLTAAFEAKRRRVEESTKNGAWVKQPPMLRPARPSPQLQARFFSVDSTRGHN